MGYFLAPYIGDGSKAAPFRPRGSDQPGWSAIDLRTDSAAAAGFCLLHLPVDDADPLLEKLADGKAEAISVRVRNILRNLDPTVEAARLDVVIARLLRNPPAGKWKALLPVGTSIGLPAYEAWLGGERIFLEPVIAGGLDVTDNFDRANADPLSGNWAAVGSEEAFQVVSNHAELHRPDGTADSSARYSTGAFSADQYSQMNITMAGSGGDPETGIGPGLRFKDDGTREYYRLITNHGGYAIAKIVATAYTLLKSGSTTWTDGALIRGEAEGSTIRLYIATVLIDSATDTSITAAGRPGMTYSSTASGLVTADNWGGGDFVAPPPATVVTRINVARGAIW